MNSFQELGLIPELCQAVADLGFESPTEVQQRAIPTILNNERDLIALAQTGTGKTGAFGLPTLQQIDPSSGAVQVLVLSPTRELAIQIAKDIKSFAKHMKGIKSVAIYGGANISTQIRALEKGCQVVIGTPGRMLDLINRRKLDVTSVKALVLDEADEMLNMGFQDDLDAILADTPAGKQTLLFSATMPKPIAKMAQKYMRNPEEISVGVKNSGAEKIDHHYYMVQAKNRFEALKRIVDISPDIYGIIFCRTRSETADIAARLSKDGYNADLLNGDLSQAQRDEVMNRFRNKDVQLLVATDVAARGLDVYNLSHVINFNLPDDLEVYIHRSGRTGRAGNSGTSISIVHSREMGRIRALEKISGKTFQKKEVPTGEEVCGARLLQIVDKVRSIQVDEQQIEKFLPVIEEKLADLDRNALIKHFVSAEFNHILEYYKNADNINVGSGERGEGRNNGRDSFKKEKRSRRNDNQGAEEGYTRFFLNIGERDGINPPRLMGVINEYLTGRKPDFGRIDIQRNFSFFEVEEGFEAALSKALNNGAHFEGRAIMVEPAKPDTNGKATSSRKNGFSNNGRKKKQRRANSF